MIPGGEMAAGSQVAATYKTSGGIKEEGIGLVGGIVQSPRSSRTVLVKRSCVGHRVFGYELRIRWGKARDIVGLGV